MPTDTTTMMNPAEMSAEIARLREAVAKAEQREDERQRKLRPIVGLIRILTIFLSVLGAGLLALELTYGFKGHMAAAANQFIMLGAVMAVVLSAFAPLTGRPDDIGIWRTPARQAAE